jgi:hypothetical protein
VLGSTFSGILNHIRHLYIANDMFDERNGVGLAIALGFGVLCLDFVLDTWLGPWVPKVWLKAIKLKRLSLV